ncbi:MAG: helix-turn-helix transcriptional regulator [Desulfovibrionaceae bacterium]|nr:helix-turn-helix transcriptional regulator [Desulfovibrionaceae bacterium]
MSGRVGARIRAYRENQKLSLADMAGRTGLSEEFLRAVEQDEAHPSLGPLMKIARALGVRLGTFLDDQVSRDPLIVRRSERRQELTTHQDGPRPENLRFYSLGRGKTDRHMEPFFITINPEPDRPGPVAEPLGHEGEEFIVVLSGQVRVEYGAETHLLLPGDSVYYNSVVPHRVSCAGDGPAEIYAVVYFPD